jgi:hypothetical protein
VRMPGCETVDADRWPSIIRSCMVRDEVQHWMQARGTIALIVCSLGLWVRSSHGEVRSTEL